MSGHSKWNTIKRKKGANDAARAKVFGKLIRVIEVAAREGGSDLDANFTLADAVQKAKDNSVPKDTIERAVKRGAGEGDAGETFQQIVYEGYGPQGIAVLMECLTENRNRTSADVRHSLTRNGGQMADPGSVSYLFSRRGQVIVKAEDEDEVMMAGLDAGLEDVETGGDEGTFIAWCAPSDRRGLRAALEAAGITVVDADSPMIPSVNVEITDEAAARKVMKLMEALEDNDDVQNVYANFDIPEAVMEAAMAD